MPFIVWISCSVDPWLFKRKIWPGDRDTHRERTLFWLLRKATDQGMRYDLLVTHHGREHLDRAVTANRGVLVIGVHSVLLYLAGRYLYDLPIRSEFVGYDLDTKILGTRYLPEYLRTDATVLLKTKRLLQQGAAVFVMIDRLEKSKTTLLVHYAGETIFLSKASVDVAVKAGAQIVFMNAFMCGNRPALYWGSPSVAELLNSEDILNRFTEFLSATVVNRQ